MSDEKIKVYLTLTTRVLVTVKSNICVAFRTNIRLGWIDEHSSLYQIQLSDGAKKV